MRPVEGVVKIKVGSLVRIVHELYNMQPGAQRIGRRGFVRRVLIEGDEAAGLDSVYEVELIPDGEMIACSDVALVDGDVIGTLGDLVRCGCTEEGGGRASPAFQKRGVA